MTNEKRQILVTSALPYANAPLHLGHILEAVQTDIWVRFQRLRGHECHYVCADDAHGTAIMLKAEQEGVTPEQHIENIRTLHESDFRRFLISVDNYYSTHSPENRELAESIYNTLDKNGQINRRVITQAFDQEKGLFLADRFIKGTCPKCKTADQYGDNCEACGATYTPAELIDAVSALSGAKPVQKESEHFFFDLRFAYCRFVAPVGVLAHDGLVVVPDRWLFCLPFTAHERTFFGHPHIKLFAAHVKYDPVTVNENLRIGHVGLRTAEGPVSPRDVFGAI